MYSDIAIIIIMIFANNFAEFVGWALIGAHNNY